MTSGGETGKRPEKPSFSLTFSLLRQYVKENGCPADLGLAMPCRSPAPAAVGKREAYKPPATINLLPSVDVSGDDPADLSGCFSSRNSNRSKELCSDGSGFAPFVQSVETKKPERPQLTIFYGGEVMVFDNFPAEKAEDLMRIARKSSNMDSDVQSFYSMPSESIPAIDRLNLPIPAIPPATLPPRPNFSDLPIARKASLHRFLEKRKDRINAKAPYQMTGSKDAKNLSKQEDISKPWLGLRTQVSS